MTRCEWRAGWCEKEADHGDDHMTTYRKGEIWTRAEPAQLDERALRRAYCLTKHGGEHGECDSWTSSGILDHYRRLTEYWKALAANPPSDVMLATGAHVKPDEPIKRRTTPPKRAERKPKRRATEYSEIVRTAGNKIFPNGATGPEWAAFEKGYEAAREEPGTLIVYEDVYHRLVDQLDSLLAKAKPENELSTELVNMSSLFHVTSGDKLGHTSFDWRLCTQPLCLRVRKLILGIRDPAEGHSCRWHPDGCPTGRGYFTTPRTTEDKK